MVLRLRSINLRLPTPPDPRSFCRGHHPGGWVASKERSYQHEMILKWSSCNYYSPMVDVILFCSSSINYGNLTHRIHVPSFTECIVQNTNLSSDSVRLSFFLDKMTPYALKTKIRNQQFHKQNVLLKSIS